MSSLLFVKYIRSQETKFKVTFLKKGTESVQEHIDYDFIIIKDNKELFRASKQTGQPFTQLRVP